MPTFTRPPCEIVVNKILPCVRSEVVRILSNTYNMRQIEIANIMGITQASVSQYLTASRGKDKRFWKIFPEIKLYAGKAARDMVEDLNKIGNDRNSQSLLCTICRKIRDDDRFSTYITESGTSKNENLCDLCESE